MTEVDYGTFGCIEELLDYYVNEDGTNGQELRFSDLCNAAIFIGCLGRMLKNRQAVLEQAEKMLTESDEKHERCIKAITESRDHFRRLCKEQQKDLDVLVERIALLKKENSELFNQYKKEHSNSGISMEAVKQEVTNNDTKQN